MKSTKILCIASLLFCVLFACTNQKIKQPGSESMFAIDQVTPVNFPNLDIPGFNFPEDSTVINNWIHTEQMEEIHLHGWGIWTGLTAKTDQYTKGFPDPLRTYETWLSPAEIIDSIKGQNINRSNRVNLKQPRQLTHRHDKSSSATASIVSTNNLANQNNIDTSIHEAVCYSPAAAGFALNNKIFMATTLFEMAKIDNRKEIPVFPNNAITVKPVFKVLNTNSGETKFNIATWHGPTDELIAYPESAWNSYVTVDITNESSGAANTYNLSDFISFKFNEEDAHYFNKTFSENSGNEFDGKPGDIAILVAMHVSTREINNWTWQTFWWAPDADNPPAPSSKFIANQRPSQLQGAARHYAMSQAYYMVNPNEPYSGENIKGDTMIAFNPYLEASFGPNVFDDDISFVETPQGDTIKTYVGVRTNCISCHRMASISPDSLLTANQSITPYVGDSFVSKNENIFKDQLLVDFAWSIEGNIDTTGLRAYLQSL